MPLYQYVCASCGTFQEWIRMAEADASQPCPKCHVPAPRALASPHIRGEAAGIRYKAEAHNELSANEPKVVRHVGNRCSHEKPASSVKAGHSHGHKHVKQSRRPWMVGH